MAVGTEEGLSGNAEALAVNMVRHAVSRRREDDAVAGGRGEEEAVVVRILEIGLDEVVVDVAHGELRLHPVDPEGLELEVSHGSRGVLGESLVYAQADLPSGARFSLHKVIPDYPSRDGVFHACPHFLLARRHAPRQRGPRAAGVAATRDAESPGEPFRYLT